MLHKPDISRVSDISLNSYGSNCVASYTVIELKFEALFKS